MTRLTHYKGKICEQIVPKTSLRKSFVDVKEEEKFGWAAAYNIVRQLDSFLGEFIGNTMSIREATRRIMRNKRFALSGSNGDSVSLEIERVEDDPDRLEITFELIANQTTALKAFNAWLEYEGAEGKYNEVKFVSKDIPSKLATSIAFAANDILLKDKQDPKSSIGKFSAEKSYAIAAKYEQLTMRFLNEFIGEEFGTKNCKNLPFPMYDYKTMAQEISKMDLRVDGTSLKVKDATFNSNAIKLEFIFNAGGNYTTANEKYFWGVLIFTENKDGIAIIEECRLSGDFKSLIAEAYAAYCGIKSA